MFVNAASHMEKELTMDHVLPLSLGGETNGKALWQLVPLVTVKSDGST